MNKSCIKLDNENFCTAYSVFKAAPVGWIEIPATLYPLTAGQKFDMENMQWLDEYADWYMAPTKPELSEAEQRELDRDELLLDNVINDQQIILLLEKGGDKA